MKSIFAKIIDREIHALILHEDDQCLAIRDIEAKAPVHFLVIPKKTISRLAAAGDSDAGLLGHLLLIAARVAKSEGLSESGFRIVINNGPDAGESRTPSPRSRLGRTSAGVAAGISYLPTAPFGADFIQHILCEA